jgi:hypothetical protein
LVVTNDGLGDIGRATSFAGYEVQFLYQPATGGSAPQPNTFLGELLGSWELYGSPIQILPLSGQFTATLTTGPDVPPGGNVWLMALGWNGGYTSLSAAEAGDVTFFGATTVWSQTTGSAASQGDSTQPYFPGLELTPTPEPTTLSLLTLCGTAGLVLLRCKHMTT